MRTKQGKIKKKYKKTLVRFLIAILGLSLLLFGLLAFLLNLVPEWYYELIKGDPALNFCMDKCDGKNVYSSNNNSDYNFVRCECVTEIQRTHSPNLGGKDYPKIKVIYFDSQTYEELNKTDVIKRIEENK